MTKVSVVMSAYNAAETIERAVGSVLAQSLRDLELIVVEDGSADDTAHRLALLAREDSRLTVLRQENSGLTRALERACREARGSFIARHDADDWSEPDRFEAQVRVLLENPAIGFVTSDVMWHSPDGRPLRIVASEASATVATRALVQDHVGPPAHGSVMFRAALYRDCGGYRPAFYYAQDIDLWLRFSENALLGSAEGVLYHHVRDPDSISGAAREVQWAFGGLARECAVRRAAGESETGPLGRAIELTETVRSLAGGGRTRRDRALASYNLAVALLEQREPSSVRYLLRTIRLNPLYPRAWIRLVQLPFFLVRWWMRSTSHGTEVR